MAVAAPEKDYLPDAIFRKEKEKDIKSIIGNFIIGNFNVQAK